MTLEKDELKVRDQLYDLLAYLMRFKIAIEQDPPAFVRLLDEHRVPMTASSTVYHRIINLVWGPRKPTTKSALRYAKVLTEAEANGIEAEGLVAWINQEGGIEDILDKVLQREDSALKKPRNAKRLSKPEPTDEDIKQEQQRTEMYLAEIEPMTRLPEPVTGIPQGHTLLLVRTTETASEIVRVLDEHYYVDAGPLLSELATYEHEINGPAAPLLAINRAAAFFTPDVIHVFNDERPRAVLTKMPKGSKSVPEAPSLTILLKKPIQHFPSGCTVWANEDFGRICRWYEKDGSNFPAITDRLIIWEGTGRIAQKYLSRDAVTDGVYLGSIGKRDGSNRHIYATQLVTYLVDPVLWSATLDVHTIEMIVAFDRGMKRKYLPEVKGKKKRTLITDPLSAGRQGTEYQGARYMLFTVDGDLATFAPVTDLSSGGFKLDAPTPKILHFATLEGAFSEMIAKLARECRNTLLFRGSEQLLMFEGTDAAANVYTLVMPLIKVRLGSMDYNCPGINVVHPFKLDG